MPYAFINTLELSKSFYKKTSDSLMLSLVFYCELTLIIIKTPYVFFCK